MTRRTRYVPNPNLERDWLATQEAVDFALAGAQAIAAVAEDEAPERSGNLKDSIEAVADRVDGQALGRVNAHDFKAHWIEFGTAQPGGAAQPFLRPAGEAVTGKVTGGET